MSFARILNSTHMMTHAEVLDGRSGGEVLTAIAKMTWAVGLAGNASIAVPARPVREFDVWTGKPIESSLLYPSDLVPEKPGTDILLVGTVHPTKDRRATEQHVGLRISTRNGYLQKAARVYGPRHYVFGALDLTTSPPGPLEPVPLVFEHMYGGVDRTDAQRPLIDRRNPIGLGVARDRRSLVGRPAPRIEDIEFPLSCPTPVPPGFGAIPPHWEPRSKFSGTHDEAWARQRAPLPPLDRDPRFYCSASPGLWSATPLLGDEPIEVVGLNSSGMWSFRLPQYTPVFSYRLSGGTMQSSPTHLDTLLIDADRGEVEWTFRTSIPVPRKVQMIEVVTIAETVPLAEFMVTEHRGRLTQRGAKAG